MAFTVYCLSWLDAAIMVCMCPNRGLLKMANYYFSVAIRFIDRLPEYVISVLRIAFVETLSDNDLCIYFTQ